MCTCVCENVYFLLERHLQTLEETVKHWKLKKPLTIIEKEKMDYANKVHIHSSKGANKVHIHSSKGANSKIWMCTLSKLMAKGWTYAFCVFFLRDRTAISGGDWSPNLHLSLTSNHICINFCYFEVTKFNSVSKYLSCTNLFAYPCSIYPPPVYCVKHLQWSWPFLVFDLSKICIMWIIYNK